MFTLLIFLEGSKTGKDAKPHVFFKRLKNIIAKQKGIELIFILNRKNINYLELIQEFQKNSNVIIKFSYFNKKLSINNVIKNISSMITNDYFVVLPYEMEIEDNFLSSAAKILNSNSDIDVLEMNPVITGEISWRPKCRLNTEMMDKVIPINENNEVIAFTFPFIFNKFYSTNLLTKVVKNHLAVPNKEYSNLLFTSIIYLLFLYAKKYYYHSNTTVTFKVYEKLIPIPNDITNNWTSIKNSFIQESKYLSEIFYAKWFYLNIIMCSLYASNLIRRVLNKRNFIQKKWHERLMKLKEGEEYIHFELSNKYMLLEENEEKSLLKHVNPISTWNKLLKELEKKSKWKK